jgi:hypothetical protein
MKKGLSENNDVPKDIASFVQSLSSPHSWFQCTLQYS